MFSSRFSGWSGLLLLLFAALIPVGQAKASPIYNGGPVITGTPHVYYIWYGSWGADTATTILPDLITNLSGTSYMNIATSYSTGSYTVGNQVTYSGSTFVNSTTNSSIFTSNGTSLDGDATHSGTGTIAGIVSSVLAANPSWASDSQGIFDVLTASTISVSGFNTSFCGWHYSTAWGGSTLGVQYGFIGDPVQGGGCNVALQDAPSANGNFGADAMASVIAHELFETVTDPLGTAWWDSNSSSSTFQDENADMCAWQFGTTFTTGTGGNANVTLNGSNYLLQQQWLNQGGGTGRTGGACTTSLALLAPAPEPASLVLLLPAVLGLATVRWRRLSA